MKKTVTKKTSLPINAETLRKLAQRELTVVVGGASNTYCAGCGSGTTCPE